MPKDENRKVQEERRGHADRSPFGDRFLKTASIVSLSFLMFVAGAFISEANVFPSNIVGRAYFGAKAAYENLTTYRDVYTSRLWYPGRSAAVGVVTHDSTRAWPGVTLYTSGHGPEVDLIDMDGRVLHRWRRPYSTVWRNGAGPRTPKPDTHVWFHSAQVTPDGHLLAVYEAVGDTPYGYGLVKLDRDSNVVWSYLHGVHHLFDTDQDGTIYALAQEIVDDPLEGYDAVGYPRLDDFLVVLSPEGEELRRISLIDALATSPFRFLLQHVTLFGSTDPTHANSVQVLGPEEAEEFPFGEAGQVLVSLRELSTVAVVDIPSERVVWAARGAWFAQHDAQVLPNGRILMFDNWGDFEGPTGISRAIEVEPSTGALAWVYRGTAVEPLASEVRSTLQRLPNGNTLISESDAGRLFEITPEGETVWQFYNPRRGGASGELIAVVNAAERIPWTHFESAFAAQLQSARSESSPGTRIDDARTGDPR